MRYVFLDIDGVLNHEEWYVNRVKSLKRDEWWEDCFDPECVKRINNILQTTQARLVVSSSWRWDKELKRYFEKVGITTDFDITPTIPRKQKHGQTIWPIRGDEVAAFLKEHPCESYVILDDDTDFTEEQLTNHFVHCCPDYPSASKEGHIGETGLTDRKMNEAIQILNSTK